MCRLYRKPLSHFLFPEYVANLSQRVGLLPDGLNRSGVHSISLTRGHFDRTHDVTREPRPELADAGHPVLSPGLPFVAVRYIPISYSPPTHPPQPPPRVPAAINTLARAACGRLMTSIRRPHQATHIHAANTVICSSCFSLQTSAHFSSSLGYSMSEMNRRCSEPQQ